MSTSPAIEPSSSSSSPPKVSLELILEAVHDVRDDLRSLREEHLLLKQQVNGSKPPPNGGPPTPPIAAQLTAVQDELKRQSSAMGLAGLVEWFASPGATAKVLRVAGVLSAFYAALHAAGVVK